jgi:hypothetical protein
LKLAAQIEPWQIVCQDQDTFQITPIEAVKEFNAVVYEQRKCLEVQKSLENEVDLLRLGAENYKSASNTSSMIIDSLELVIDHKDTINQKRQQQTKLAIKKAKKWRVIALGQIPAWLLLLLI